MKKEIHNVGRIFSAMLLLSFASTSHAKSDSALDYVERLKCNLNSSAVHNLAIASPQPPVNTAGSSAMYWFPTVEDIAGSLTNVLTSDPGFASTIWAGSDLEYLALLHR
jgi:hypothetical protein